MRARRSHRSMFLVVVASMLFAALLIPAAMSAQEEALGQRDGSGATIPEIHIDALAGNEWSIREVYAAPGQKLIITNRDVKRHTFVVVEWDVEVRLPVLTPVEVLVPGDARPGDVVTFFSDVGNQREDGLEGTLTILTKEEILARNAELDTVSAAVQNRMVVELADDFAFAPSEIITYPGAIIEVRNTGVMEHHFAVDEWMVNVTISPGMSSLVQVPLHAEPGDSFTAHCTIPGHSAAGMTATILIDLPPDGAKISTLPDAETSTRTAVTGLHPFLPEASTVGSEWTQLRTGNASSVIAGGTDLNINVFPGEGVGAAYVGPSGSRATIVVMPLQMRAVPPNQVQHAIDSVQAALTQGWATDQLSSVSLKRIDPPKGCDIAHRSTGIVPLLTLPAGSTVCQIRSAGVVIFVTVEGEIDGESGAAAADALIIRMLSGE